MLENPQIAKDLIYNYRGLKSKGRETSRMELSIRSWQNNRKNWTNFSKNRILIINMLLKQLINNLPKEKKNININGLTISSKNIKKGFIFFAIKGHLDNGEKYIPEAVKKGAVVVICSKKCKYENNKILIIKTSNIRFFLSEISSKFYKLKPKNLIAVTGTNGKTSVADLYYQILHLNNIPVASIGTLGLKYQ